MSCGQDGRLIKMQLEELIGGLEKEEQLIVKDYILQGKNSYWVNTSLTPIMQCLARCTWLVFATILGVMTMRMVRVQPTMAKMGRATLFIYIYHSFIIEGMRVLVKQGILPGYEMMLFLYATTITLGLAYLSRFKLLNFLLNPISYKKRNE